ncbi:hypothetical protein HYU94_03325 [Candidatus Daviesbacteria bacterium]|nr:hypothetical protein [Candidatus Daviesbacteria bacterium]
MPPEQEKRVLVAADEPGISGLIRDILTDKGLHVETTTTGEGLILKAEAYRPDLLVIDFFDHDGQILEKLIQKPDLNKIPIIGLTHGNEPPIMIPQLVDFIPTPNLDINKLIGSVKLYLNGTPDLLTPGVV